MCAPRSNREVRANMGRMHRPHQPGAAFHIVARTQGHQPLFVPELKREVQRFIIDGVASGGARLISHVVMDNHIHVVLFQGSSRLGWVMQPILRRTALLVQRHHRIEGHVFERRFRSKQCESTEHLRNCILYVHRNPVDARMCATPAAYEFSSARAYEGLEPCGNICVEDGLQSFGCPGSKSGSQRRTQYLAAVRKPLSDEVIDFFGYWLRRSRNRGPLTITRWKDHDVRPAADIRDAALRILKAINPHLDVDVVRSRYGGPEYVSARTQLIASLSQRGYVGSCVADYLRVSAATVSRVRSRIRWETAKAG
jgi:putative transposase